MFLGTPDRDSNLDLPVIGSLVYCKSGALGHAATKSLLILRGSSETFSVRNPYSGVVMRSHTDEEYVDDNSNESGIFNEPGTEGGKRGKSSNKLISLDGDVTPEKLEALFEKVYSYLKFPYEAYRKCFNTIKMEEDHVSGLKKIVHSMLDSKKNFPIFFAFYDKKSLPMIPISRRVPKILNQLIDSRYLTEDQRKYVDILLEYIIDTSKQDEQLKKLLSTSLNAIDGSDVKIQSPITLQALKAYKALVKKHLHSLLYYGRDFQVPKNFRPFEVLVEFLNYVSSRNVADLPDKYREAIQIVLPLIDGALIDE
uniref:Uncharacterized protein n=1 Tax=Timema bartmani TaxID=61472 RepID=A0A7R9HXZ6_9NEOP|nr:unnamed protein product [Timema bartmani]